MEYFCPSIPYFWFKSTRNIPNIVLICHSIFLRSDNYHHIVWCVHSFALCPPLSLAGQLWRPRNDSTGVLLLYLLPNQHQHVGHWQVAAGRPSRVIQQEVPPLILHLPSPEPNGGDAGVLQNVSWNTSWVSKSGWIKTQLLCMSSMLARIVHTTAAMHTSVVILMDPFMPHC